MTTAATAIARAAATRAPIIGAAALLASRVRTRSLQLTRESFGRRQRQRLAVGLERVHAVLARA